MGNRGLTRALQTLVLERPDLRGRFREIILAAPDVDAEVFRRDLVPALRQAGQRVTLYASSNDLALKASSEPAFREMLDKQNLGFVYADDVAFKAKIASDNAYFKALITKLGIKNG